MKSFTQSLVFSIRSRSEEELDNLGAKIGDVLGIHLIRAGYASGVSPYLEGELWGMIIQFGAWPLGKQDGVYIYQLHGVPRTDLPLGETTEQIDISDYIAAFLELSGVGVWYKPTQEEIFEEMRIAEEIDVVLYEDQPGFDML